MSDCKMFQNGVKKLLTVVHECKKVQSKKKQEREREIKSCRKRKRGLSKTKKRGKEYMKMRERKNTSESVTKCER